MKLNELKDREREIQHIILTSKVTREQAEKEYEALVLLSDAIADFNSKLGYTDEDH